MSAQTLKKLLYTLAAGAFLFLFSYLIKVNLALPFFLITLYFSFYKKIAKVKSVSFKKVVFLFLASFALGYFFLINGLPVYLIPVSIIPMLTVLLYNNLELGFFISLTSSLAIAFLSPNPFKTFFLFMIPCSCAILLVNQARKRTQLLLAGFIAGAAQLTGLFLFEYFSISQPLRYLGILVNGLLSGIAALGILPLFEHLTARVTNISLLELTDSNNPILQRMILEAPGTYHHSLIVGNLSDTACQAIGANGLLARIGAYYHDIGKLEKPEYFIENQGITKNVHDELSPTMSKLVIMNHIKEGMALAKKYHLSPMLWDFIQQHHGNSLVYYFYRRALEGKEEDQEVAEEGFRYPGPKPATKETAVVLLADSVEAATRALKDPTPDKIGETVHKVINNKFIDGQLDECELTLKDIEKISGIFTKILSGIYHSRVNYPQESIPVNEAREHGNNHKKPSK